MSKDCIQHCCFLLQELGQSVQAWGWVLILINFDDFVNLWEEKNCSTSCDDSLSMLLVTLQYCHNSQDADQSEDRIGVTWHASTNEKPATWDNIDLISDKKKTDLSTNKQNDTRLCFVLCKQYIRGLPTTIQSYETAKLSSSGGQTF